MGCCHPEGPRQAGKWACVNIVWFNKAKWKVLCLGWVNPSYQHRLRDEGPGCSPAKKALVVLVDEKLDTNHQSVLAAQNTNRTLGCIKKVIGQGVMALN